MMKPSGEAFSGFSGITSYGKRMVKWAQMDTEVTMWQMVNLCFSPSSVCVHELVAENFQISLSRLICILFIGN